VGRARGRIGTVVFALFLSASCCGERGYWSFPLTCSTYGALTDESLGGFTDDSRADDQGADAGYSAAALAVLLSGPVLLDLVLLPVTGAHDLWIAARR